MCENWLFSKCCPTCLKILGGAECQKRLCFSRDLGGCLLSGLVGYVDGNLG